MIADGQTFVQQAWWICLFPGLAAISLGLGLAFLGDGLGQLAARAGRHDPDADEPLAARGRRPHGRLRRHVAAVRGVSFTVQRGRDPRHRRRKRIGQIRDLPGAARPAAQRRQHPAASVWFAGATYRPRRERLARVRGPDIGMIFQNPSSHLDPLRRIGGQIAAPMRRHFGLARAEARRRAVELLDARRHPRPQARRARLSARVFRRHEAAGDDRRGDRLRAEALDRRRADHRARRDGAGPHS